MSTETGQPDGLLELLAAGGEALRRGDDRLPRQGELLRAIADTTGDILFVKDRDCRLLYVNPAAQRAMRGTERELLGTHELERGRPPDEAAAIMENDRRVMRTGVPEALEERLTIAGRRHTFLVTKTPLRDASGGIVGLIGVSRDVTAERRAEAVLGMQKRVLECIALGRPLAECLAATCEGLRDVDDRLRARFELADGTCVPAHAEAIGAPLSVPLHASDDGPERDGMLVLGFADAREPDAEDLALARDAARLAGIAIAREEAAAALRQSEAEARAAAAAATASETRLRRLTEANIVGVIRWDLDRSLVLDANDEFLRMTGYTRADLQAGRLDFRTMTPPEWTARNEAGIAEIRAQGAAPAYEKEYFRRDGTRVPVIIAGARLDDSAEGMSIVLDLSDRKRAERLLEAQLADARQRAARQAMLADTALRIGQALSSSGSREAMLQAIAEAAREALDVHRATVETNGRDGWGRGMVHALSSEAAERASRDDAAEGGALDVPLAGRDDREIGVLRFSDKRGGTGFDPEDAAVAMQIAAVASVALENASLLHELHEADRKKSEFLATLAHELRNPLAPIRTGVELMGRLTGDPAEAARVRAMMERQVRSLVRLTDDLLDVSRIDSGKLELRRETVDLARILDAALETSRPAIAAEGHAVATRYPAEPVLVDGDPTRLAQVFANLLNNAARYTPAGGHIEVSLAVRGARAEVAVRDDGIGIAPAMLERVFDMFTQAGRTAQRTHGGLGIGLTLVKRLVEMHGGTVAAASAGEGRGATFTVELPCLTHPAENPADERDRRARIAPRRVLVADDNEDAAESLAALLALDGHDVRTARDGHEALTLARELRPELVLLDLGMPVLDGFETCRRMRNEEWSAAAMIVALTGWGQEDDRARTRAAGFDAHLVKPVEFAALEELLERR